MNDILDRFDDAVDNILIMLLMIAGMLKLFSLCIVAKRSLAMSAGAIV